MTKEEKEIIEIKFKILEKYHVPKLNGELKTTGDRVGVYAAFGAMTEYANRRILEVLQELENEFTDKWLLKGSARIGQKINEIKKLLGIDSTSPDDLGNLFEKGRH